MNKLKIIIIVGLGLFSCNYNESRKKTDETQHALVKKEIASERETPNDDATKNSAFIELENYQFQDSKDYGKRNVNRTLIIEGKTNLPEKTIINVDIYGFVPSTKEENINDTYGTVEVVNEMFTIELKPWNVPQSISFRVFKDKQTSQVMEIIGKNGEKLKIAEKNKPESSIFCVFQNIVKVNEQIISELRSSPPHSYIFQKAIDFSHPSEKALANFIGAWKKKNWSEMLKYTQRSQNETSESLKNMFEYAEVVGFKIISKKKNPDSYVKNWYSIKYELSIKPTISHQGIQTKIMTANVINENGHWGVNASSALRGLYN